MQSLINALTHHDQALRSKYHLTLGELLDVLNEAPPNGAVEHDVGYPALKMFSYRGYYCDLAIEFGTGLEEKKKNVGWWRKAA